MKSITLKVEGMHCGGCADTIKGLVEKQPGVHAVAVSFDDGQARILYDPQAVGEDHLIAVIQEPGFRIAGRAKASGG